MKALCVLISANFGNNPAYLEATKELGKEMAKRKIKLIYGGTKDGLMGALADSVLENGGEVIGVVTKDLYLLHGHLGLSEQRIVDSLRMRKKIMIDMADGFIAAPGGIGTYEEIFSIWNEKKLNIHNKFLGILNTNNYYSKLIELINHGVEKDLINFNSCKLIEINASPSALLDAFLETSLTLLQSNDEKEKIRKVKLL